MTIGFQIHILDRLEASLTSTTSGLPHSSSGREVDQTPTRLRLGGTVNKKEWGEMSDYSLANLCIFHIPDKAYDKQVRDLGCGRAGKNAVFRIETTAV